MRVAARELAMDQREHTRACACIYVRLNSTCVEAVLSPNVRTVPVARTYARTCVRAPRVCIHGTPVSGALSRVRVKINIWRHWVMITPRCACRGAPCMLYAHMHVCTRCCRARPAHASGTICRISRNFRVALVTCGVNNVHAPKLFPSRNGGRASRPRVYWTFLNRRRERSRPVADDVSRSSR